MAVNNYDGKYLSKSGLDTLWTKIKSVFMFISDAGTLTKSLNLTDYFTLDQTTGQWSCTVVPPLYDWIITQNKDVIFHYDGALYRFGEKQLPTESNPYYSYYFYNTSDKPNPNEDNSLYNAFWIHIPNSSNILPANVALYDISRENAYTGHAHGNVSTYGKSTQYPSDTTRFLRGDGNWVTIPVEEGKELSTYWGSSSVGCVKFCTTTLPSSPQSDAMSYGVFSFSRVQIGTSVSTLYANPSREITGTIQICQRYQIDLGLESIEGRATILQPDYTGTLSLYYKKTGNTVDWYLVTNSDTYIRTGFNLMHKHTTDDATITPLSPSPITDISDLTQLSNSGFRIPLIPGDVNAVGGAGQPVYVDSTGQIQACTLNGSPSVLKSLHPDTLSSYSDVQFCVRNSSYAGGYLTLSDTQKSINGKDVGYNNQFCYVSSSGNITTLSGDAGSEEQSAWLKNGAFSRDSNTRWILPHIVYSNSQINLLTDTPFKSAPNGAVVIIPNTFAKTTTIPVIYNTNVSNPCNINAGQSQVFVKKNNSEWSCNT